MPENGTWYDHVRALNSKKITRNSDPKSETGNENVHDWASSLAQPLRDLKNGRLAAQHFLKFMNQYPEINEVDLDFVARSAASRPNIFYPEIHEVDLWQVYRVTCHTTFTLIIWLRNRKLQGQGYKKNQQCINVNIWWSFSYHAMVNKIYRFSQAMVTWHWPADTLFWQVSIATTCMDAQYQRCKL